MNVNSGGPHLLLFERDQQLTALLTSEFQLAGYECHAARTAVEVFDAIARYPIRLVLVNLAQAAAGRREFWVALDAQRRGRGVQVFTFRCTNLAGYGADDPDERARTVLADMEVDGMLGVMNLVDAVRARIPGSTTGSMSRISAVPPASAAPRQVGMREAPAAPASQPVTAAPPSITGQVTTPLPMFASDASAAPSAASLPPVPTAPSPPSVSSSPSVTFSPPADQKVSMPTRPAKTTSGFTDKILAVIYPGSRNVPQMPVEHETDGSTMNAHFPAPQAGFQHNQLPANASGNETGLEQLLRMISDQGAPMQETKVRQGQQAQPLEMKKNFAGEQVTQQQAAPPPISTMSLRASPIQDIGIELVADGPTSGGTSRQTGASAMPGPAPTPALKPAPISVAVPTPAPTPVRPENEHFEQDKDVPSSFPEDKLRGEVTDESAVVGQIQVGAQGAMRRNSETATSAASDDDTLLNIVQSFPAMPSQLQQAQQTQQAHQSQPLVLSGRATRSLGSVLLEGHLVPQQRLEVAQHIQRVLRGVDMNYQLGEILLMFKLLTPDQLLAASLVSYGLISAVQISALGRIRQELHSIGLEYDLESLLVLFRILSPEQLREVRSSWSG